MPEMFPTHDKDAISKKYQKTQELLAKDPNVLFGSESVIEYLQGLQDKGEVFEYGLEKFIIKHPGNEKRLVGIAYDLKNENIPPYEEKRIYYSSKLLHALFPNNIPDIHMVSQIEINSKKTLVDVREKVDEIERSSSVGEYDDWLGDQRLPGGIGVFLLSPFFTDEEMERLYTTEDKPSHIVQFPFLKVLETLKSIGVEPHFDSHNRDNIIQAKDGGEYYVDSIVHHAKPFHDTRLENINTEKLQEYLKAHTYSERDQERIFKYLQRIREIVKMQTEEK